jgi:hypothetical protein
MVMKVIEYSNVKKQAVKHIVFWCSNCGFTHNEVKPKNVVIDGETICKPLCSECRKDKEWYVECFICGKVKGHTVFPTTVKHLTFDNQETGMMESSCNVVVPLCPKCKESYSSSAKVVKKLDNIEKICLDCPERFKCLTSSQMKLK